MAAKQHRYPDKIGSLQGIHLDAPCRLLELSRSEFHCKETAFTIASKEDVSSKRNVRYSNAWAEKALSKPGHEENRADLPKGKSIVSVLCAGGNPTMRSLMEKLNRINPHPNRFGIGGFLFMRFEEQRSKKHA